jgi:hypothetical protein
VEAKYKAKKTAVPMEALNELASNMSPHCGWKLVSNRYTGSTYADYCSDFSSYVYEDFFPASYVEHLWRSV